MTPGGANCVASIDPTLSGSGHIRKALRIVTVCLAGLGFLPRSAEAQDPYWAVDIGGARLAYDSLAALNAPSLSGLLEWQRPAFFSRVGGSLTGFEGNGWSGQGRVDVSTWRAPSGSDAPLRLEFAGAVAGSHHSSGFDAYLAQGDARLHIVRPTFGLWLGATLAVAKNSLDTASVQALVPAVGGWAQNSWIRGSLSLSETRLLGRSFPEARLSVTATHGFVDATAFLGARALPDDAAGGEAAWLGASAAAWLRPGVAVVISGGESASDLLQGLPGADFFSIGIRFTQRRRRPIPPTARAPIVYTPSAVRSGGLTFDLPRQTRVQIAGDWTDWQKVELERTADGRWLVPTTLAPGVYRFNLWVDDERWMVPEGFAEVDDGFGGRVGLLIISEGS